MRETEVGIGAVIGRTTIQDVEFFRNHVRIGQRLTCMIYIGEWDARGCREQTTICRLLKKGRHVAQTTKGTMQWTLLTIWNRSLLEKLREEDRQMRRWRKQLENGLYL